MADLKSTRPSRELLQRALAVAAEGPASEWWTQVIVDELLALQRGMEELEHQLRHIECSNDDQGHGASVALRHCADELQKLREGT